MRNTQQSRAPIILPLRSIRIPQDLSENPEKRHGPCDQEQRHTEISGEEENGEQPGNGVCVG